MYTKIRKIISPDRIVNMIQDGLILILNPLLANPIVNGNILTSVILVNGSNIINHKLGRKLQGWYIVRQRGSAAIYDTQDSNTSPSLTLTLTSSAGVTVDIAVF